MFENLKAQTLLIVEDEVDTAKSFERKFKKYFKKIYIAYDGEEGYEQYQKLKPNAILTDITMPKMDGLTMIKQIRKVDKNTPISVLTAHKTVELLYDAIPLKLDQYIIKPIMKQEILKYLSNLSAHFATQISGTIQVDKDHIYNFDNKELLYKGKIVSLTYNEIELLELFIKNINSPISYEKMKEVVLKETTDNALRVFVSRFRSKKHNLKLETITNLGYKLQS